MLVKLENIKSNPHRDFERLPLDLEQVALLKDSISTTTGGYWGGIVVRNSPDGNGTFELAFGHHRIQALKELGYREIEAIVRDYDDVDMLKVMITENDTQRKPTTEEILETVLITKEYLDGEIQKCENLEAFKKFFKSLIDNEHSFLSIKGKGIGTTTLQKFLRGKNYNSAVITQALDTLRHVEDKYDIDAIKLFKTPSHAEGFKLVVKEHNIKREFQYDMAQEVMEFLDGSNKEKKLTAQNIGSVVKSLLNPPYKKSENYQKAFGEFKQMIRGEADVGWKETEKDAVLNDLASLKRHVETL